MRHGRDVDRGAGDLCSWVEILEASDDGSCGLCGTPPLPPMECLSYPESNTYTGTNILDAGTPMTTKWGYRDRAALVSIVVIIIAVIETCRSSTFDFGFVKIACPSVVNGVIPEVLIRDVGENEESPLWTLNPPKPWVHGVIRNIHLGGSWLIRNHNASTWGACGIIRIYGELGKCRCGISKIDYSSWSATSINKIDVSNRFRVCHLT